jgi:hypothetical protein
VLDHLGSKWTTLILQMLEERPQRFSELHRAVRASARELVDGPPVTASGWQPRHVPQTANTPPGGGGTFRDISGSSEGRWPPWGSAGFRRVLRWPDCTTHALSREASPGHAGARWGTLGNPRAGYRLLRVKRWDKEG